MLDGAPRRMRPKEISKMRNDPHKDWDNLFNQLPLDTTLSVEQLEKVKR
jgi:hypothetical protein